MSLGNIAYAVNISDKRDLERLYEYAIIMGNTENKFSINSSSGVIYLINSLDYEQTTSYSIGIVVADITSDPASSESATTTIDITVIDYNDNPPIFLMPNYLIQIDEDVTIGSTILVVEATDIDSNDNALIQFSILDSNLFGITPNGEVFTISELDYEQQVQHIVSIEATDSGTPSLSATAILTINLNDINDERPFFNDSLYSSSVSEATSVGTIVLTVSASDPDTLKSDLTYELIGTSSFTINSSGIIHIAQALDYETVSSYSFDVVVSDGVINTNPLGTSEVIILITDVNDNPPMFFFAVEMISISIYENTTIDSIVLNASAIDLDTDLNGFVSYSINQNDDVFSITNKGFLKLISLLDRESISCYNIMITAVDSGSPQLASSVLVNISVIDVNDNAPEFNNTESTFVVSENQPQNSVIGVITAFDVDTGVNAALQYSILPVGNNLPFSVEASTGVLFVSNSLDYELNTSYSFAILVEDNGTPSLSNTTAVHVELLDENDNSPIFSEGIFYADLPENASIGFNVIQLISVDIDSGLNSYTEYFIQSGDLNGLFSLNLTTGQVHVFDVLDYEEQSEYELVILANNTLSNKPLSSTVHLIITINDINEFHPEFIQELFVLSVFEGQPIGTFISLIFANDNDTGLAGESVYMISPNSDPFEITNGELVTTSVLDRESINLYTLTVFAVNIEYPFFSTNTTVLINVQDINDNAPIFLSSSYKASIPENSPAGYSVSLVPPLNIQDFDALGPNSKLNYSIDDPLSLLTIDPLSGVIFLLTGDIDYEEITFFEFSILASDNGQPSFTSEVLVEVAITNQNDISPTITGLESPVTFIEGTDTVSLASSATITDEDELLINSISVRLVTINEAPSTLPDLLLFSDPNVSPVSMNNGRTLIVLGTFTVTKATDILRSVKFMNTESEPNPSSRYFQVSVSDGIHTVTSSLVEVKIQLVNDNSPMISLDIDNLAGNYETVFVEDGLPVSIASTSISLEDKDEVEMATFTLFVDLLIAPDLDNEFLQISPTVIDNSNYQISYSSFNQSLVIMGTNSYENWENLIKGITYYNSDNDPSVDEERLILLTVSDTANNSITVNTTINIVAVNDPPFLNLGVNSNYEVTFVEGRGEVDLTNETSYQLTDNDSDSLFNATITLINPQDGASERIDILTSSMDGVLIEKTSYSIIISGIANVSTYSQLLSEARYYNDKEMPTPTIRNVIFTVNDGDLEAIGTTYVSFSFVNDPPIVDLNGQDIGNNYTFVFIEDTSPIPAFASTLTVNDVDSSSLSYTIVALTPIPVDSNEGISLISSSLVVTGNSSYITIQGPATSQEIQDTLRNVYYYNDNKEPTQQSRTITVSVSDGETLSENAHSLILILLQNDVPVVSLGLPYVVYKEESDTVSLVDRVSIIDDDNTTLHSVVVTIQGTVDGNLEVFQYSPPTDKVEVVSNINANTQEYFFTSTISSGYEGFTDLLASIGYKHLSLEPTPGIRELSVVVNDGLDTSDPYTIIINVTLSNDNTPLVTSPILQATVTENIINVPVYTISAEDVDSSIGPFASHGQIVYSIVGGNTDNVFHLNSATGVLSVVGPVDREVSPILPLLIISITNPVPLENGGNYPNVYLLISVQDQNDGSPQWENIVYNFEIVENPSSGSVVGSVSATDSDIGSNAAISYSLLTLDTGFTIDETNGAITVLDPTKVDREISSLVTLTVEASDGGNPPLYNTTTVYINVLDENDNVPSVSSMFIVQVEEDIDIAEIFYTIVAEDPDNGVNGSLTYSVLDDTSFFDINETSGGIYSLVQLDRETNETFTFDVVISDQGNNSLSTITTVIVTILDVNDNSPMFLKTKYSASIFENEPGGQLVVVASAIDNDVGNNSIIEYSVSSNVSGLFVIHPVTGEIKSVGELDAEMTEIISFEVFASDSLFTATATVEIYIEDVNDNIPVFSMDNYTVNVFEDVSTPFSLLNISAKDIDITLSNITYSIQFSEYSTFFDIDPFSGNLLIIGNLDREENDYISLLVEVSDNEIMPLKAIVNVFINILDVNDNPPLFDSMVYNFTVVENSVPHSLGTVNANDPDALLNGKISYYLLNGDTNKFEVNNTTGEICIITQLDREFSNEYVFAILAQDGGSPSLNSTADIYITVMDVNDNSPQFQENFYEVTLSEDYPLALQINVTIKAIDSDSTDINSQIMYSITSDDNVNYFHIDSISGALSIVTPLDAESSLLHIINVTARDTGTPTLSSSVPVYVTVTDINDNEIDIQSLSSSIEFIEEGDDIDIFPNLIITDDDVISIVDNATVSITNCSNEECSSEKLVFNGDPDSITGGTLVSNDDQTKLLFTGNFTTEEITIILRNVRYENMLVEFVSTTRHISLVISDGVHTSERSIRVDLIRINDNAPVIDLYSTDGDDSLDYFTQFTEGSQGAPVALNVSITDADSGSSLLNTITISILNPFDDPQEVLVADSNSDISVFPSVGGPSITLIGPANISAFALLLSNVRYFNYEDNPTDIIARMIQVTADDGTHTSVPSFTTIAIHSVNDPPILFLSTNINSTITYIEDSPSVLIAPNAQLSDSDSFSLKQVSFELIQQIDNGFEYLLFSDTNGLAITENTPTSLVLSGSKSISSYLSIIKSIRYINNASEPTAGERLISVVLSDGEAIAEAYVFLNISLINDPPVISIVTETVSFIENGPAVALFPEAVHITDSDSAVLSSAIVEIINPVDQNDEYLFWNGSLDLQVNGNVSNVLVFQANSSTEVFELALSFVYYVNEAKQPTSVERQVKVTISDGYQNSTPVYVIINVVLLNSPPEIVLDSFGNDVMNIFYTEEIGSISLIDTTAQITDDDNSFLSHMLVTLSPILDYEQESIIFSNILNSVIVQSVFDNSSFSLSYTFTFSFFASTNVFNQLLRSLKYENTATEPDDSLARELVIVVNDSIDYSNPAVVIINITLLNDNQPEFLNSIYNFSVPEKVQMGSIIGRIEAVDLDKDDQFYYVLLTENVPFIVDGEFGELTTIGELDREITAEYELQIGLSISLDPISLFNSEAKVYITVEDVNESPSFNQTKYVFTVSENATVGTEIGTVMAEDFDSGENGSLNLMVSSEFIGIDTSTGILFTASELDREAIPSITVTVVATDSGVESLSTETEVQIFISDVNDNSPVFSEPQYNVQLIENTQISSVILIVTANDLDIGSNGEVSFSFLDGDNVPFLINETTGIISTSETLMPTNYTITIVATDKGDPQLNATALLSINIYSIDSGLPLFDQQVYEANIPENSNTQIYLLTVSASDPIFNSTLTYSLNTEMFFIDSTSGDVFSNAQFDRENQSVFSFTIVAESSDNRQGFAELVVTITDVNDFPPVFSSTTYNFSVLEGSQSGEIVGHILAIDSFDTTENAIIANYEIDSNTFTIDNNGTIFVLSDLDRETQDEYSFNAYANDSGNPSLSGTTLVLINIKDVNDNPPNFTKPIYEATVIEEIDSPLFVLNVSAYDVDLGKNAQVTYSIDSPYFTVNSISGEIYTNIALDYEQQAIYSFTVYAIDNGDPSLNASSTVQVTVINVDDTPPVFNQTQYLINMTEELPPSTHIVTLIAYDTDSNDSDIMYAIVESDDSFHFDIDSTTGNLFIASSLDREESTSFSVVVSAISSNVALSSTATVTIMLADINDNPPSFVNDPISFSIPENATNNTIVGTVQVIDIDEGSNAVIGGFFLLNGTDTFTIDPNTGVISTVGFSIDREMNEFVLLFVSVHDMGNPELTSSTTITVIIEDINDNPPVFEKLNYTVSILESTVPDTPLITVIAADKDQDSIIEYFLLNSDSSFVINSTTGQLSLVEQLDYETQMTYELSVLARDGQMHSFLDSATVTVNVLDVDDIPPYFDQPLLSVSVIENSAVNTPFSNVFAKDDDTVHVAPIIYSILEDDVPFSVNAMTGELSVKTLLDRELNDSYVITVQAQGFPNPPATVVVTIEINDVNDFVPSFTNDTYIFKISESSPVNSSIGEISVFDNDINGNGEIISVFMYPSSSVFILDNTSLSIHLNAELDYEQMTEYTFNITAIDGGTPSLTGTTTVTIIVVDENDNTPIIQTNTTILYVSEDTDILTTIATIEAIDLDAGTNGMIKFTILSGQLPVSINQSTGELYITNSLTPGNYSVIVTASDLGTPARSSSLTITVIINDVNQQPSFASDVYTVNVSESVEIGTMIITVVAIDADDGMSGIIRYNLSNSDDYFGINETSGEVSLLLKLDREIVDSFEMTLIVVDEGEPALTGTALLLITITDVNDNAPIFSEPEGYFVNISEAAIVGEMITTITATDDDIGLNSKITFTLSFPVITQSGLVSIGSTSGILSVKKPIDKEVLDNIIFTVIAFDSGNPSLSQSVSITVTILDADDNPPVFSSSLYTSVVSENITIGTYLPVNVSAEDIDIGENGIVNYRINSDLNIPFSINSETGVINVTDSGLDREMNSSYSLILEAYNPFSNIHVATAMLSVEVVDINDNSPFFIPSNVFSFEVAESLSVSSIVGFVMAVDEDAGSNAEVMYYFVSSNETQYLNVDTGTGEVYLVNQFDYEDDNGYSFQITVEDKGMPSLSSIGTVVINVINTNDIPPFVNTSISDFTYIEQSPPINIGSGIVVSDGDNLTIDVATVELTLEGLSPVSDQDFIALEGLSSSLLTLQSNEHNITITGPASAQVFTEALQLLQFGSASEEPLTVNRIITIKVNDGVFDSNIIEVIVAIETINDHIPVIDFNPSMQDNNISITYKEDEDDELLIVPADTLIFDADSGSNVIVNGSAVLLVSPDEAYEHLSAKSTGNVIVTLASPFEVIFDGEATLNQFLIALKTLTYTTTDNNQFNITTTRLVEVVISDGKFISSPSYISITVLPSNDPPTLSIQNFILNYTENDASISVFGDDLSIDDVDSLKLAYISIQLLDQVSDLEYFTHSTDDTNITVQPIDGGLMFDGPASVEDFTIVLQSVNYTNTAINSSLAVSFNGSKRIQITLFDGIDLSDIYEIVITFSGIDDSPIVDLNGDESPGLDNVVTYFEEGEPVLISPQATIIDVDSKMINSALIQLSNRPDNDTESLLLSVNTTLENSYDISTGKLSIIGKATTDVYQQLLQSVSYNNSNSDPTIEDRIVSVTMSDETSFSSLVYTTIQVLGINDPPILTVTGMNDSFIEAGPGVGLFKTVEIIDVDNTDFKSINLNILNAEDVDFEGINGSDGFSNDELTVITTVDGNNIIRYSFQLIDGTNANFQTLLLSLTYYNVAPEPSNTTRIIEVSIDDGEDISKHVQVEIPIVLVNDNPPFYISGVSVLVSESITNGSIIHTVVADDLDVDSIIHYTLTTDDNSLTPFYINMTTGDITVTGALDREMISSYSVCIIANDTLLIGKQILSITVEDINDNQPVFDEENYEVIVSENETVNSFILIINATDADAGTNAQVQYQLLQSLNIFALNRTTGVLSLNTQLDYESQTLHNLTVIATDYGTPNPLSSTTYILVNVANINDNPPLFESTDELIDVLEDSSIGTFITSVSAIDPDGYNITYSLMESDDLFNIDEVSGVVHLIGELDRELSVSHTLTIVAIDTQSPTLFSTLQLTINVKDVDDNPPNFIETHYNIVVTENANISTSLLTLEWDDSDIDANAEAKLDIIFGNEGNSFIINSDDELLVSSLIDREQQASYSLTITVSGLLTPSFNDTVTINITVLDENDFAPTFEENPMTFILFENVSIGSTVGVINAIDNDIGTNAMIMYSLTGNSSLSNDFVLEANGTLRVNQALDLEALGSSIYSLNVLAIDSGQPSQTGSVLVLININDVNEFSPVFTSKETEVVLFEDTSNNTVIATIVAEDDDFETIINYSLVDTDIGFVIDMITGELFTNRIFDFENNETVFNITVVATDNGMPQFSSTLKITVFVDDVNEFAPVFADEAYFESIPENTSLDSTVVLVHANDKDSGDAGIVAYRLIGDMLPFNVTDEGYIIVTDELDREDVAIYTFSVEGFNLFSNKELSSVVPVSITITDVNDNPPVILLDSFTTIISSAVGINSTIYEVEATDIDIGDNAVVKYSIIDQNSMFSVEESTGIVRVASDLLSEGIFTIEVIAVNIVTPAQNDSIMISITVVASYSLEFSTEGPGFFTNSQTSTSATMDMFIKEPYGTTGHMTVELVGASVLKEFSVEYPPAVSVDGTFKVYC